MLQLNSCKSDKEVKVSDVFSYSRSNKNSGVENRQFHHSNTTEHTQLLLDYGESAQDGTPPVFR